MGFKKVELIKDWESPRSDKKVYKKGIFMTLEKKQADKLIKDGFAK